MLRLQALGERLRLSLWFVPAIMAGLAGISAPLLMALDRQLAADPGAFFFLFGGTAEGARNVLSTIAQSMLTFTGLVFSITMLVLQLASSQLSPRVMRTFLRDRGNQFVLGLFVATFVFTLLVLREVRDSVGGADGFVPGLSIWVAFTLLLGSVGAFIYYIDHMAHAIRSSTVIVNIAGETVGAIERMFPERAGKEPPGHERTLPPDDAHPVLLKAPRAGILIGVDEDALIAVASRDGRRLELVPGVGDFVPEDSPIARLHGSWDRDAADRVRKAVQLGDERTLSQDAAFGIRQLVDVALRALSPGTNDPTTAIQAIDRIHDLLRRLATRDIPSPVRLADDGRPVLRLPRPSWDDYVRLGIDEVRLAGRGQIQVARRLRDVLEDLETFARDDRLGILRQERMLLDAELDEGFPLGGDRSVAEVPSARGHALASPSVDRASR